MGLFSSSSKSKSVTTNETYNTSGSIGDLSTGNVQGFGDVTVTGIYGEDLGDLLDTLRSATQSNSTLAGTAISEVAQGYQSAYSETSGIIRQLKPVLMVAVGVLALVYAPKLLKEFK